MACWGDRWRGRPCGHVLPGVSAGAFRVLRGSGRWWGCGPRVVGVEWRWGTWLLASTYLGAHKQRQVLIKGRLSCLAPIHPPTLSSRQVTTVGEWGDYSHVQRGSPRALCMESPGGKAEPTWGQKTISPLLLLMGTMEAGLGLPPHSQPRESGLSLAGAWTGDNRTPPQADSRFVPAPAQLGLGRRPRGQAAQRHHHRPSACPMGLGDW